MSKTPFLWLGANRARKWPLSDKARLLDHAAQAGLPVPPGAILLDELFGVLLEAGVIAVQDGLVTAVDAAWLYETLYEGVRFPRLDKPVMVRAAFSLDGAAQAGDPLFAPQRAIHLTDPAQLAAGLQRVWSLAGAPAALRRDVLVMEMVNEEMAGNPDARPGSSSRSICTHALRQLRDVLGVVLGQQHRLDARAVGGDGLSFRPPMGSTLPRSVTSPVMATSRRTGRRVKAEMIAVAMAMPALGPSLGVAPSGTWMWTLTLSNIAGSRPSAAGVGPRVGQRRLGRFLHHVAQRAGQRDAAGALAQADLDGQRVAAKAVDRQPGDQADLVLFFGHAVVNLRGPMISSTSAVHRKRPRLADATFTASLRTTLPRLRSNWRTPASSV
jgi:hypothetical protein